MIFRIVAICILLFFSRHARADGWSLNLTAKDINEVSNTLQAFDEGKVTLDEITIDRNEEWGRKLITYYATHTDAVTTKMKLPISRCCAGFGGYPQAIALAKDYVSVYSNDWHGWRIIGSAYFVTTNFGQALGPYTNAVLLGDQDSSASLGFSALKVDRLDVVREFLPQLFRLKDSHSGESLQAAVVLVIYSLRTEQKDIFVKALDGISPQEILAHEDVTFLVKQGFDEFKGKDIEKIQQELESASKNNLNAVATTNAPSP